MTAEAVKRAERRRIRRELQRRISRWRTTFAAMYPADLDRIVKEVTE